MTTSDPTTNHRAELHGTKGRPIQAEHLADLLHANEKASFSDRIVAAARDIAGTGDHDPEQHDALLDKHEGKHHVGVIAGVLRRAGLTAAPKTCAELVELAKGKQAFVSPKGKDAGLKPKKGDVVVLALDHPHQEHAYVVCSISEHHLESLDGGQTNASGEGRLVEYRSRQWQTVTPKNEQGMQVGPSYVLDSAHVHLANRRHPPRVVSGWVDSEALGRALAL